MRVKVFKYFFIFKLKCDNIILSGQFIRSG